MQPRHAVGAKDSNVYTDEVPATLQGEETN